MNNEIIYLHCPQYILEGFDKLSKKEIEELDSLVILIQKPDDNFEKLVEVWNTNKKFRIIKGALL